MLIDIVLKNIMFYSSDLRTLKTRSLTWSGRRILCGSLSRIWSTAARATPSSASSSISTDSGLTKTEKCPSPTMTPTIHEHDVSSRQFEYGKTFRLRKNELEKCWSPTTIWTIRKHEASSRQFEDKMTFCLLKTK